MRLSDSLVRIRKPFRLQCSNSCCLFSRDEIICLVRHSARNTDNCSVQAETGKGIIIQASQDKFHPPRRRT
jgi:hypothetical protein